MSLNSNPQLCIPSLLASARHADLCITLQRFCDHTPSSHPSQHLDDWWHSLTDARHLHTVPLMPCRLCHTWCSWDVQHMIRWLILQYLYWCLYRDWRRAKRWTRVTLARHSRKERGDPDRCRGSGGSIYLRSANKRLYLASRLQVSKTWLRGFQHAKNLWFLLLRHLFLTCPHVECFMLKEYR